MRKKLLVMEDDKRVLEILALALGREGYQIIRTSGGLNGLRLAEKCGPDLIVIDLARTEPDSFTVCRGLRESGCEAPVLLFLTSEEQAAGQTTQGLDFDYLSKPFQMRELLMRIKVNTWEKDAAGEMETVERLVFGRLEITPEQVLVTKDGLPIELTKREFDLLNYLAQESGKVFPREELLKQVWEYSYTGDTRSVDVTVRRLREKLEDDPAHPAIILTRRGRGYAFMG